LLSGEADISGLTATVFFDLPRWQFWSCTPALHRRWFVEDVYGGTLVYRRRVWEHLARYPKVSLGEDAVFLRQAILRGARLGRLPNDGEFIYLRHSNNSWSFACGQYLHPQGWQRVPEPNLPAEDRAFYSAQVPGVPSSLPEISLPSPGTIQPLVSCIMPTAHRRVFVPQAIRYFLRQDYPNRELIIADDGTDAIGDLLPSDSPFRTST
jgi:hypothetical protein